MLPGSFTSVTIRTAASVSHQAKPPFQQTLRGEGPKAAGGLGQLLGVDVEHVAWMHWYSRSRIEVVTAAGSNA